MKKIVFALVFYLFFDPIYAQDLKIFLTNTYTDNLYYLYKELDKSDLDINYKGTDNAKYSDGVEYPSFIETKDDIFRNNISCYIKIEKSQLKLNDNGFLYFTCKGNIQNLIYGGNYYAVKYTNFLYDEDARINDLGEIFHKVYNSQNYNTNTGDFKSKDKKLENDWNSYASRYLDYSLFVQNIIKSVRMNVPYLQETINGKTIIYDDDILKYRWFDVPRYGSIYANCTKPMVEGDSGNGVGVELNIDFYIPSDNIVILNGYADWNKQHLYKQNARMKKVKVEGEDFSLEYDFEDYVHFSQIDFPKKTKKIKITVLEVYDGSKWADMAISGMWVNPDITKTANSKIAEEYLEYAQQHCVEFEE